MYISVEIDGKTYPVSFGMNALVNFGKRAGVSLQEFGNMDNFDLEKTIILIWCGLSDGYRKAKKAGEVKGVFKMDLEDVGDLLDSDPTALNNIMNVFADAMPKAEGGNGKTPPAKRRRGKRSPLIT